MIHSLTITGARGAPSNVGAVVFDFDDTIADTLNARLHATRALFEQAGISHITVEDVTASQRGTPLAVSLDHLEAELGLTLGLTKMYRAVYWTKGPGLLSLFDGMPELLNTLRKARIPTGVVTSKARNIVVEGRVAGTLIELAELRLDWLAPHTVGVEDVTHPKPHPEGLQRVLAGLGVEPQDTLVVGDSASDIQTAHNAGCWSCLAGWGIPADQRASLNVTPDVVAEHPLAIRTLVRGLSVGPT